MTGVYIVTIAFNIVEKRDALQELVAQKNKLVVQPQVFKIVLLYNCVGRK